MIVKVVAAQTGPASSNKEENVKKSLALFEEIATSKPDFVVFPELFLTHYFCCTAKVDTRYFEYGEGIDGPSIRAFGEAAKKYGCYVVLPFFENSWRTVLQ